MGRPTDYSPEITAAICGRLALGESLRSICRSEDTPAVSSVMLWLNLYPEFSEQYARARELQAEYHIDAIIEIADDATNDYMLTRHGPQLNSEHINRSRLRIDTRKWVASKLAPKKYGDKLDMNHSGAVGVKIGQEYEGV